MLWSREDHVMAKRKKAAAVPDKADEEAQRKDEESVSITVEIGHSRGPLSPNRQAARDAAMTALATRLLNNSAPSGQP